MQIFTNIEQEWWRGGGAKMTCFCFLHEVDNACDKDDMHWCLQFPKQVKGQHRFSATDVLLNLAARWCTFVPFNIELLSLACRGRTSWQAAYKLGSAQWFSLFPAVLHESNSDTLESVTRRWKQTKPQILPEKLSSAVCPKPSSLLCFVFCFVFIPLRRKKKMQTISEHVFMPVGLLSSMPVRIQQNIFGRKINVVLDRFSVSFASCISFIT